MYSPDGPAGPSASLAPRPAVPGPAVLPPAAIEPLFPKEDYEWPVGRGTDSDAGLWLDERLRRLARQESLCRRTLGELAAAFLRRRAWQRLGFARIGDWSRERLGLSPREVQSLARVTGALSRLPALAAAFARGELSWTKCRLLVGVASPTDEARWVGVARDLTVRALDEVIRAGRKTGGVSVELRAGPEVVAEEEGETADGEERARFRLRCPPWVSALFRRVVELARCAAGESGPTWKAAEAIAAEGQTVLHPGQREIGRRRAALLAEHAGPAFAASAGDPEEPHGAADAFPWFDWRPVIEAIPEDVEKLGRAAEDLDPFELDARMRSVLSAMQRVDWQTGRLLHVLEAKDCARRMGFASLSRYVRERLGISSSKARALIELDRRAWHAPPLGEAYRRGEISWVRALMLLPLVGRAEGRAAEARDAAWVLRASQVPVSRLGDEIEWAFGMRDASRTLTLPGPPPLGASLELPEVQMRAPSDFACDAEVVFTGPASVVGLFRETVCAFAGTRPVWVGLVELLLHAETEWERTPKVRDPVFRRDRFRCLSPCCGSRRDLHDHHFVFRSRGGGNQLWNRGSVCWACHQYGIHAGTVRCHGRAPDDLVWELGVRPGREPLLRLWRNAYVE